MSDETKATPDGPGDLMRLWLDMASQTAQACQAWSGAAASPEAFRQGRSDLFKVWSDYWEQFLRSSSFLEAQKRSLTGSLEYRKQFREYLGRLHHELQLASAQDIDQLMISVRRMGEDLREQFEQAGQRLDGLSTQLGALAARVGALEKSIAESNPPASAVADGESPTA